MQHRTGGKGRQHLRELEGSLIMTSPAPKSEVHRKAAEEMDNLTLFLAVRSET